MNEIQIFKNPQFGEIRTAKTESGSPLFCLSDVCNILDIKNVADCKSRLNEKGIVITDTPTNGGIQRMTFITESNLYKTIFQSRKPEAEQFQDWVCEEVLPAIRKNGAYVASSEEDTPEIIMARGLMAAKEAIDRLNSRLETKERQIELQAHQLISQAPKVDYYNEVLDSTGLISTTIIAKDLGMSAAMLNKKLHQMGIIYRHGETWVPYSKYQSRGWVKSKTFPYIDKDGKHQTAIHFYWTEQGREFIMNRILTLQKASLSW